MKVRAPLVLLLILAVNASSGVSAQNRQARRTASVAGRILHPDGSAAEQARIAVYAVREGAPAAIVGTATSSYDGRYEVTGLPAGPVIISVTPQRGGGFGGDTARAAQVPAQSFYPGTVERDRAVPITLFDNVPAEGIDIWLAPAPQRYSISGTIFGPPGVELDDLVIEYGGPHAVRRGLWHVDDPRGVFTIEGVAQETYVLLTRADTPSGPFVALATTYVANGPVEDVRLVLKPAGTIAGRLVVEGSNAPDLAGVRVMAVQQLLALSPLYPRDEVPLGTDGRFEIPAVTGEFSVQVNGLPAGWRVRRMLRNGSVVPNDRLSVGAGEQVSGVELVIGPGST